MTLGVRNFSKFQEFVEAHALERFGCRLTSFTPLPRKAGCGCRVSIYAGQSHSGLRNGLHHCLHGLRFHWRDGRWIFEWRLDDHADGFLSVQSDPISTGIAMSDVGVQDRQNKIMQNW